MASYITGKVFIFASTCYHSTSPPINITTVTILSSSSLSSFLSASRKRQRSHATMLHFYALTNSGWQHKNGKTTERRHTLSGRVIYFLGVDVVGRMALVTGLYSFFFAFFILAHKMFRRVDNFFSEESSCEFEFAWTNTLCTKKWLRDWLRYSERQFKSGKYRRHEPSKVKWKREEDSKSSSFASSSSYIITYYNRLHL